jgi:putative chitinase
MNITLEQFKQMIPSNKDAASWYSIAIPLFEKYNLNTVNRIAGFMAQTSHESNDFNVLQENLNYSATRLLQVFPSYFTKETAASSAKKPEIIANIVYNDANRKNKIGNTQPGDGYRFRGRGIIQLTGRWNYDKFGKSIGKTAEEAASYLETKQGALESALWYWNINNINKFADSDDINGMSKAVNGGDVGLAERVTKYNKNKQLLKQNVTETKFVNISRGSKGDSVSKIQKKLSLPVDGIFGITTEASVRSWQRSNRYEPNGIITEEQYKKLVG